MSSEASPLINRLEQKQLQQQKLCREVVLVAGGTGLLGLGIVKALLCRNALVVVPSRSQDQLDTLVREVARIRDVGQPPTPVSDRRAEGRVHRERVVRYEEVPVEKEEQQQHQQHGSPRPPYLQPPLSLSAETTSSRDLGRLFTILADVGDPKGAAYIRETILERFGRLDRVITAMSRFWGKGVTTEQSYEEWDTALRDIVGVHFVCVKEFLPVLKANGRGSYTFVTGRGGEVCICPEMGLMTVGTCALFGLVEAVKEEAKRGYPGVTINEVRLGLRVVGEGEEIERAKEIYGEHTCTNATYVGKAIAAIALSSTTRTDHPPFYLYSLQEVDEVLRNLWSFHKRQPARGKGDVDRDKETINQENENRQQEVLT